MAHSPVRFDPGFVILDETDEYIVVDKPAPLQVHPSVPGSPPTLLDGLKELLAYEIANGARLSIINRLDRETSGVVIIAKCKNAAREFHRAMERRQIDKEYTALVWGWPGRGSWRCEEPIRRQGEFSDSEVWVKQAVHREGASAGTVFDVLENLELETGQGRERFALVKAVPKTGRMHQIRVHLAHAGHPVVGDKIYGPAGDACYLRFIKTGWTPELERLLLLPRHALHCARMSLSGTGDWKSPVPAWVPRSA